MSAKHEIEIEISPKGEVQVHVKGAKGKRCLDYVEIFEKLGEVSEKKLTGEYYEPGPNVGITEQTQNKRGGY